MSNKTIQQLQYLAPILLSDLLPFYRPGNTEASSGTFGDVVNLVSQIINLNVIASSVAYKGAATLTGTPGDQTTPAYWTALTPGTYTNYGGVVLSSGNFGVIYWDGFAWGITQQSLDGGAEQVSNKITSFANISDVTYFSSLAVSKALSEKYYNPLWSANSNGPAFSPGNATDTVSIATAPGALPYNFIFPATLTTASAGANSSFASLSYTDVVSTSRVIYGAWFYKPALTQAGITGFGWYIQSIQGASFTSSPILFTSSQLVSGTSQVSGSWTSTCTEVNGDWAYIVAYNTEDMPSGTTGILLNAFINAPSASASFTSYIANVTLLFGATSINPYIYYDNSLFYNDISKNISKDIIGANVSSGKRFNYGNILNNNLNYWGVPLGANEVLSFAIPPGALPFNFHKNAIHIASTAGGQSAYISYSIPVDLTDRFVYGCWFYMPVLNTAGVNGLGIYGQYFTTVAQSAPGLISFDKKHLILGASKTVSGCTLTVEAINGDWCYLSFKNNADMISGTTAFICSPYIDARDTTTAYDSYIFNFSFLKGLQQIDAYQIYDNSSFAQNNPLYGLRLYVEGDSIMQQGYITSNVALRTQMSIINTAVSGNTYATNSTGTGSILPRLSAILPSNCDMIMIGCGTNDWHGNTPLGSLSSRIDLGEFYSALYNAFLIIRTNNPITPVLILLPSQRYFQGYLPDGTDRPNLNALGLSLLDYIDAMKVVAALFSFKTCDLYSEGGLTYENLSTYTVDGVHPNALGAIIEGGFIVSKLNSFILS